MICSYFSEWKSKNDIHSVHDFRCKMATILHRKPNKEIERGIESQKVEQK